MEVVFRPRAENDLDNLYDHLRGVIGIDAAFDFVWSLRKACLSLGDFPNRGTPREDVAKGLRILPLDRRSVIAYRVESTVVIVAIFHGGQNWTDVLRDHLEDRE